MQEISLLPIFAGAKLVAQQGTFHNDALQAEAATYGYTALRLYYVDSGSARVCVDGVWYDLSAGQLFLIPKYACHSYECTDLMNHYYICRLEFFSSPATSVQRGFAKPH